MTQLKPLFWTLLGVFFTVAYMASCEMPRPADASEDDDDAGAEDDAGADDDDAVPGDDDDTPSPEYPSGWTYDFVSVHTTESGYSFCVDEMDASHCVLCGDGESADLCLKDAVNAAATGGCEFVGSSRGGGPAPTIGDSNGGRNWFRCPAG